MLEEPAAVEEPAEEVAEGEEAAEAEETAAEAEEPSTATTRRRRSTSHSLPPLQPLRPCKSSVWAAIVYPQAAFASTLPL